MNEEDNECFENTFSETVLVEFTNTWRQLTDKDRDAARIREEERKRRNPSKPESGEK